MPREAPAKAGPAKPGRTLPGPRPAPAHRGPLHPLLALQRTAGNRAVGRLIAAREEARNAPAPGAPTAAPAATPAPAPPAGEQASLAIHEATPAAGQRLPAAPPPAGEMAPEATPTTASRAFEAAPQPLVAPTSAGAPPVASLVAVAAAPARAVALAGPALEEPEGAGGTEPEKPAPAPLAPPAMEGEAVSRPVPAAAAASASALTAPAPTALAPAAPSSLAEAPAPSEAVEPPVVAPAAEPPVAAVPAAAPAEPAERAPTSPAEDPAFQAVVARAAGVAREKKSHGPARGAAAAAQAAAAGPPNEVAAQAAGAQVAKMDAQEPGAFDREAFKAALRTKITAVTASNLKEAEELQQSGKAGEVKSAVTAKVAEGKEKAQGSIQRAAQESPSPSGFRPKPVTPLAPTDPGPPPPDLGAAAAAPKPKTAAEVEAPMAAASQGLDQTMAEGGVTEAQLERSNEPDFQAAAGSKREAQANAQAAPAAYRADEQVTLAGAQGQAQSAAGRQTQAMHGARAALLAQVGSRQRGAKAADEQKRAEIARRIEGIYQETKRQVEARLARLDTDVSGIFDRGAEAARRAFEDHVKDRMEDYKERRYSGLRGKWRWVEDLFKGLPAEVNQFYVEGRALYVRQMDGVIDQIAGTVEVALTGAKSLIAGGRRQVQDYVSALPLSLQQVGQEAAEGIQDKFDALEQSVEDKQGQLVESLAQKYVENLQAVDARVEELKAANRGLVDKAREAVAGVIQTILELKNMLLGVLARAAAVVGTILEDPIGFLGNLVGGVKLGLSNFMSNLGAHLKQGLLAWLFGALAEAGIQVPETFDLKGILGLILQVLGLTYANIRARAVAIVGETVVARLEQVAEVFKILVTEGPAGLWRFIQDKLTELKETVMEGIKSFVMERVIMAGITWLIGLLNPVAAFIKACKAIYDVVMFFVTRGSQVLALVNAIIDSLAAIAAGTLTAAAAAIENALAKTIPVVIGFLASLLGLGGLSEKIREILQKIRAPINKAIDWVIHKAVKLVKAAGAFVAKLGKKKDEPPTPATGDPEHDAKVDAGLAAIDQEEQKYLEGGGLSRKEAEQVATKVRQQHPIFKSIAVVDGGGTWDYDYVASPGKKKKGETKEGKGLSRDLGTEQNPLLLDWPKRGSEGYRTLYLGPPSKKPIEQTVLEKAKVDSRTKAEIWISLERDEQERWGKATKIEEYRPHQPKATPGGDGEIGIAEGWRIHIGKRFWLKKGSTQGGGLLNGLLRRYGFSPKGEDRDADHVLEMQVGGENRLENLWPLKASENRSSGSRIKNSKLTSRDGKEEFPMSEVKEEAEKRPEGVRVEIKTTLSTTD